MTRARALPPALTLVLLLFGCSGNADSGRQSAVEGAAASVTPGATLVLGTATPEPGPSPTPHPLQPVPPEGFLPETWLDGLSSRPPGEPMMIACEDVSGDGRINGEDAPAYAGLDVVILERDTCAQQAYRRDFFAPAPQPDEFACDRPADPVLVVLVGGGGTDLLNPASGVSLGLLETVNAIVAEAESSGASTLPVLTSSAVFGADFPQSRMEQWLSQHLRARLEATPCMRVVMLGHSHGGVIVTTVLSLLEGAYGDRLYGVVLDRSNALYDRPADELPVRAPLLNVFQLSEGWHGLPIAQPNVENVDATASVAPKEPRLPDQPLVPVTHVNLDDATDVRQIITRWVGDRLR